MTNILSTWVLVAILTQPGTAYSTFETNCTLPTTSHNYVSAPNTRSTLDIVWSSLATIIACTYSVLHLNVPEQRNGRDSDKGWRGDLKWTLKGLWPSIKWTLVTVLAPEVYLILAWEQYMVARVSLRLLNRPPGTMHLPGGCSLAHAFAANMGVFAIRCRSNGANADDGDSFAHCNIHSLLAVLKDTEIRLPTYAELMDRSKSDAFGKLVAIGQIFYFCVNILGRWAHHLPVTLLELGALAMACTSVFSYGFLCCKPKSVASAICIAQYALDVPSEIHDALANEAVDSNEGYGGKALNFRSLVYDGVSATVMVLVIAVTPVLFGSIHLAGCNSAAPDTADKWIWRVATIVSISSPIFMLTGLARDSFGRLFNLSSLLIFAGTGLYVIARLVLMVEMVRTLFYLPPEAFISTWVANVPHSG